jgi:tetratricopeptide (TPR) repeat protein
VTYSHLVATLGRLAELVPDPVLPVDEARAHEVMREGAAFAAAVDEASDADAAAWGVARLRVYWMNGRIEEGRRRAERLLAEDGGVSAAARARMLEVAATLAFEQGDAATARARFNEAAELSRKAADADAEGMCLAGLARCELMAGNLDAAREAARACEAIRVRRGDEAARVFPLHVLAYADYIEGNDDNARAGFHRTLEMNRRLGAQELTNLCSVETRAGNLQEARALGREALDIAVELDHALLLPYCVINLAGVASAQCRHEVAARVLGAGDALLAAAGMELNPGTAIEHRRHRSNTEAALGDESFRVEYESGRSLTRAEAVAAAREV